MPLTLTTYLPALGTLAYSAAFNAVWHQVTDAPPPWKVTIIRARPHVQAAYDAAAAYFTRAGQVPMIPTPTQSFPLLATPTTAVGANFPTPSCLPILLLFGLFMFLVSTLVMVARIDKTMGRDPVARYKQLIDAIVLVFSLVLAVPATILQAMVAFWAQLRLVCRLALIDAVVFVFNLVLAVPATILQLIVALWTQLRRMCRLALALILSLFWSILSFDLVRFLVTCNIVGGIGIDLARLAFPALRLVWLFARNVV